MSDKSRVVPVLDIGNVLLTIDMNVMYRKLCETGLVDTISAAIEFMRSIERENNMGLINTELALLRAFGNYGCCNPYRLEAIKEATNCWRGYATVTKNTKILEYLTKKLETKPILVLASNLGVDHHVMVEHADPFFLNPKLLWCCSCKMGAIKPQYNFFHLLLKQYERCSTLPTDFFYVDDREENLEGGRVFGFETFQFDSAIDAQQVFIDKLESVW